MKQPCFAIPRCYTAGGDDWEYTMTLANISPFNNAALYHYANACYHLIRLGVYIYRWCHHAYRVHHAHAKLRRFNKSYNRFSHFYRFRHLYHLSASLNLLLRKFLRFRDRYYYHRMILRLYWFRAFIYYHSLSPDSTQPDISNITHHTNEPYIFFLFSIIYIIVLVLTNADS